MAVPGGLWCLIFASGQLENLGTPQAAQAQCVSLIVNTCSFILRNLKWP